MGKEVQDELKKQLEFTIEEEKLKEVVNKINEEVLKYIDRRKEITNYILEYRKNIIEEYRDDEDKVIEYFDHERYVKEEAFRTIDRRLKELNILKVSPYFGKVQFREEDFGIEQIYIGRFGVTPEGSYEPLIVDWRAPISALFYNGNGSEGSYEAPVGKVEVSILSKRQFIIKKGKLEGLFDSALDIKDDILQMVLSKNSSDKLKDIIMTIQQEQDDIIRQPRTTTVVVDGVAGSGKTTIALHRIAYLLYNYRKILEDKVLILGPNSIFMEYISTVLPSLGESGVLQTTFKDFALDLLELDTYDILSLQQVMERILNLDNEFINDIAYKSSMEYKEYLDKYINNLNLVYFKCESIDFRNYRVISVEELNKMFAYDFITLPLFRRSKKVKRIIFSKLKDVRDEEFRNIQKSYEEEKLSYPKDELIYHINDIEFRRKLKIRELIQELIEIKKTLDYLNPPSIINLYNELNENKPLTEQDLGAILYLKVKLEGTKLKREIKHVVIDEAQDYSPLQLVAIKELTKATSMTIVGDSNQRILPLKDNIVPMNELKNIYNEMEVNKFNLYKSYRSTREIMEYSNKYLLKNEIVPLVRSGDSVVDIEIKDNVELISVLEQYIDEMRSKGLENIAVITKDLNDAQIINYLMKNRVNLKVIDKENISHHDSIIIIPSYYSKGLEFDGVIIVNNENKMKHEDKLMYVMCTRALHNLYNININNLN